MINSIITNEGKRVGDYILTKQLGEGQFGKVFLGRSIKDGYEYAIKQIDKSTIDCNKHLKRLLQTEISIMHDIKHPNILHLYEFLESSHNYYMIIDYCNQGNFLDYLKAKGLKYMDEQTAVYFLKQIANGFQELRKHRILHRDVKSENFFVNNETLVIGDFGFAKRGVDMAQTRLGTPYSMAYEILAGSDSGSYDSKVDLWSVGVVYYEILFGDLPFEGNDVHTIKKDILKKADGKLPFPRQVSAESKDLISRILVTDPKKRLTWEEFFNHPLFSKFKENVDPDVVMVLKALGQIIMDNRLTVEAQFNKNKFGIGSIDSAPVQEFLNSENISDYSKTNNLKPKTVDEEFFTPATRTKFDRQMEFKEIYFRYSHENDTVRFFVYVIKKIQKVIKEEQLPAMKAEMFDAVILLFKKAAYFNTVNLHSLTYFGNIYNLNPKYFSDMKNYPDYQLLLTEFIEHKKDLDGYASMTRQRIDTHRINPVLLRYLDENIDNMNFVNEQLNKLVIYFKQKYANTPLQPNVGATFLLIILLLKFSAESESRFPYMMNDKNSFNRFNWPKFYEAIETMKASDIKKII